MQAANPITLGDQVYDRLTINLAVTACDDMSIVIRSVPTGTAPDGSTVMLDASARSVLRGRKSELNSGAETEAAAALVSAIEQFVASQGW